MLNLIDYAEGICQNRKLAALINSGLFEVEQQTKHESELIGVEFGGETHNVEVFKAFGGGFLQVCTGYYVFFESESFSVQHISDRIAINRLAISKYCIARDIELRAEISSYSQARCLVFG